MAQGLQVFDEQGNVKLDTNKQFPRIVGQITLNGDGSITNADVGYPNNKLWYMIISNISPAVNINKTPVIRIWEDGTKIMWQNQVGTVIRYGVI